MAEIQKKKYDLENRCLIFARRINGYVLKLPKNVSNIENGRQLVRSGGSVGANYLEANESLSKKDFAMRIKISRKEAKETEYWLELSEPGGAQIEEKQLLINEAIELRKIFGAILVKTTV